MLPPADGSADPLPLAAPPVSAGPTPWGVTVDACKAAKAARDSLMPTLPSEAMRPSLRASCKHSSLHHLGSRLICAVRSRMQLHQTVNECYHLQPLGFMLDDVCFTDVRIASLGAGAHARVPPARLVEARERHTRASSQPTVLLPECIASRVCGKPPRTVFTKPSCRACQFGITRRRFQDLLNPLSLDALWSLPQLLRRTLFGFNKRLCGLWLRSASVLPVQMEHL